ncbi:hypothetical protein BC937DRAFT_86229 [Endogone sp. FLAS-F59071]|nr:hypothetical protein BC937DRAFT_86229 [Endogone sp. FLAS-F59071]|eukprot:RUS22862.1 hypothetical protein BC937DRAFT_86229 [Endogone sp. FLAS-F59071]
MSAAPSHQMPTPPSSATGPSLGAPARKSSLRRATPIASTSSGISSVSALPQPTASLSSTLRYREQRERERERERAEIEERGYGEVKDATRISNRFSTSSTLSSASTDKSYSTPPVPRMPDSPSQSYNSLNRNSAKTSSVSSTTSSNISANTNIIPDPWLQLREAHHAQQRQHAARLVQLQQLEQQLADMASGQRAFLGTEEMSSKSRRTAAADDDNSDKLLEDLGYAELRENRLYHRRHKDGMEGEEAQRVPNQEDEAVFLLDPGSDVSDPYLDSIRKPSLAAVLGESATSLDLGKKTKGSLSSSNREEPGYKLHRNTIAGYDKYDISGGLSGPSSIKKDRDRDRDKNVRKRTESVSSSNRFSATSSRSPSSSQHLQGGPQPQTSLSSSASLTSKRPASKHRQHASVTLTSSSPSSSPSNLFTGELPSSPLSLTSTPTLRLSGVNLKRSTFGSTTEQQEGVVPMMAALSAAADRANAAIGYTPPAPREASKLRGRTSMSTGQGQNAGDYYSGSTAAGTDQYQSQSRRTSRHQSSSQLHERSDYYGQPMPSSSSPPLLGGSTHHAHEDGTTARRVRGYTVSSAAETRVGTAAAAGYGDAALGQYDEVEDLLSTTPPPVLPITPPGVFGENTWAHSESNGVGKRKVEPYHLSTGYDAQEDDTGTLQSRGPSKTKPRPKSSSLKSPPPPPPLDPPLLSGIQSSSQRYSYMSSPTGTSKTSKSASAASAALPAPLEPSRMMNGDTAHNLLTQRRKSLMVYRDQGEESDSSSGTTALKSSTRASMPASARSTTPKSSGLSNSIGPDGTPSLRTSFLPQPRSGSRTSSTTGVPAPLPSAPAMPSNRSSNDLSSVSSAVKLEHRKSSTTPTRASISDYHGYVNKATGATRRRSGTYSPPPPARSNSAGRRTPKEETSAEDSSPPIPPVPPVPKHHSMNSTATASIANTIKNLMGTNASRASSVSSGGRGKHGEEDADGYRGDDDDISGRTDEEPAMILRGRLSLRRDSERTATEDEAAEGGEELNTSILLDEGSKRRSVNKKKVSLADDVAAERPSERPSERKSSSRTGNVSAMSSSSKRKKSVGSGSINGSEKSESTKRGSSNATTTASTSFGTTAAAQTAQNKKVVITRKRGKTLPGSLATPPPVPSLPLPPMKVEPINIYIPTSSRKSTAKSPSRLIATTPTTRIPTAGSRGNKSLSSSGGPYNRSSKDDGNGVGASASSASSDEETTPTAISNEKKKDRPLLYSTLTGSTNSDRSTRIPPPSSPKVGPTSSTHALNSSVNSAPKTIRGGGLGSSTNSLNKSGSEYSSTAPISKPSINKESNGSGLRKPSGASSKPSMTSSISAVIPSNKDPIFSTSIETSKTTSRSRKMSTAASTTPAASKTIGTSRRHSVASGLIEEQLAKEKTNQTLHAMPKGSVSTVAAHGTMTGLSNNSVTSLFGQGYVLTGGKPVIKNGSSSSKTDGPNKALSLHDRLQGLVVGEQIMEEDEAHGSKSEGSLARFIEPTEESDSGTPSRSGASTSTGEEIMSSYVKNVPKDKDASKDKLRDKDGGLRVAMGPQAALKLYVLHLSLYERGEILDYPQIYFVGQHAQKKPATPEQTTNNFGFDDERGDYNIIMQDHLCYRYEILEVLGKGSFGQVVKAFDHKTGQTCAIKIIRNKKRFHCQALVEVKILENLVKWDPEDKHNNVRIMDHFYFRNHLCVSCECLSINLYEFIKSNNFQGFSLGLIRRCVSRLRDNEHFRIRFTTQLLNSLSLLYGHSVVHCDLKPENILLKHPTKSGIKVIDFGSSCLENEKVYTYIQSRFYRSPEVILGMTYNMAIDMWSLGCILAELYTGGCTYLLKEWFEQVYLCDWIVKNVVCFISRLAGYPLFPGENEQEQLACIMEVQGVPERYLVEKSTRKKLFFDILMRLDAVTTDSAGNPRIIPNSKGKKRRPGTKSLQQVLKCNDQVFVDFVTRCLDWDPERRMTPDEGLHHDWILEGVNKSSKLAVSAPVTPVGYDKNVSKKSLLTSSRRKEDDGQSALTSKSTSSISSSHLYPPTNHSLLLPSTKTSLSGSTSLYVPTSTSRRHGDNTSDLGVSGIGRYNGTGSLGRATGTTYSNTILGTSSSFRTTGSGVNGDGSSHSSRTRKA